MKLSGFVALLVQLRSMRLALTAAAARLLGAAGGAGVVTVTVLEGAESPLALEAVT